MNPNLKKAELESLLWKRAEQLSNILVLQKNFQKKYESEAKFGVVSYPENSKNSDDIIYSGR